MSGLLLDTHAFLWWMDGTLDPPVLDAVADPNTIVALSAVSVFEIAYKVARGRLATPEEPLDAMRTAGFDPLPVSVDHAHRAGTLPLHHRDPFDRMLIAQAQIEGLVVVTRDRMIGRYDVPVLLC